MENVFVGESLQKKKLTKISKRSTKNKPCIYCGTLENITSHHLVPIGYRRKTGLYLKNNKQVALCDLHHLMLHKNYSNDELAEKYRTWDKVIDALNKITNPKLKPK